MIQLSTRPLDHWEFMAYEDWLEGLQGHYINMQVLTSNWDKAFENQRFSATVAFQYRSDAMRFKLTWG